MTSSYNTDPITGNGDGERGRGTGCSPAKDRYKSGKPKNGKTAPGSPGDGKAACGTVRAVCVSKEKGTQKQPVSEGRLIADFGLEGDAHGGKWHRQVSLLSYERVEAFNRQGAGAAEGAFGENLLVEGIDFKALPVGTRLCCGEAVLEITQIGKECHSHCAIYHRMGTCIMPVEGVFAEVKKGGLIRPGDEMAVIPPDPNRSFCAAVIVLSDKGARGERIDESGPAARSYLEERGYRVIEQLLLPDEPELLKKELIRLSDGRQADVIFTSGGTGFSLRDQTPEATLAVGERLAPGIAEAIRAGSMQITPRAMLSRGTAVIRKKTLIVNLPGSPRAVRESLDVIIDTLPHGLRLLRGTDGECARG